MTTTTLTVFIPAQRTSSPVPAAPIVPDPAIPATPPAEPVLPRTPAQRRAYAIEVAACGSYDLLVDVATAHVTGRTARTTNPLRSSRED